MKVFSYDSALPLTLTGPGQQLGGRLLLFLPRQVLSEGQGDDHLQAGGARAVPGGLHHDDGPGVPEDHRPGEYKLRVGSYLAFIALLQF